MGRKAQPIDLLVHRGGKHLTKEEIESRKMSEELIKPATDNIKPPTWLSKAAKKEFNRLINEFKEIGLITNVDVVALATYCDAYADYMECTKLIAEEGLMVEYTNKAAETNKVPHPLLTKKKQLHEQMKAIATEFGLTPSARAKLVLPKKEEKAPTRFDKRFGDV